MNDISLLKDAIFLAVVCLAMAVSNIKVFKIVLTIIVAAILFLEIVVLFDMQEQSAEIYPLILKSIMPLYTLLLHLYLNHLVVILNLQQFQKH